MQSFFIICFVLPSIKNSVFSLASSGVKNPGIKSGFPVRGMNMVVGDV